MKLKIDLWVRISDDLPIAGVSDLDAVYRSLQVICWDKTTVTGWISDCIVTLDRSRIKQR